MQVHTGGSRSNRKALRAQRWFCQMDNGFKLVRVGVPNLSDARKQGKWKYQTSKHKSSELMLLQDTGWVKALSLNKIKS